MMKSANHKIKFFQNFFLSQSEALREDAGLERGGGGERGKRKGIPGKGGKKRKFPFLMKRNSRALQNLKKNYE